MKITFEKAQSPGALAERLAPLASRLTSLVESLTASTEESVAASDVQTLTEIASALREAAEPTPPSATAAEKADVGKADAENSGTVQWPADLNVHRSEMDWGADPTEIAGE